jgi:hypothetical protein
MAAWVVAIATVVLVGITGFYAWSTHNLLRETRRQVNLALGRDVRSIAVRRRKLLLIGRRIDDVLSSIESSEKPRETLLWTEEEFGQLEALLPEFEGLHVNDTSSLLGLLTKIRHRLPATPGPAGIPGDRLCTMWLADEPTSSVWSGRRKGSYSRFLTRSKPRFAWNPQERETDTNPVTTAVAGER